MNKSFNNSTVVTPESARRRWFRNANRAGRAYFYATWAATLLDLVGLLADYDDEYLSELVDARGRMDDLLVELREELVAKFQLQNIDPLVTRALLDVFENGAEEGDNSDDIFDGLYQTDLIDKAAVFITQMEDACSSAELVELDDEEGN